MPKPGKGPKRRFSQFAADESQSFRGMEDLSKFKKLGGFVYFDRSMRVCRLSGLSLGPGFHFRRQMISEHSNCKLLRKSLQEAGRLLEVTLDSLLVCGVTTFTWLCPGERISGVGDDCSMELWPHGAFAYFYSDAENHFDCIFSVLGASDRPDDDSALSKAMDQREEVVRLKARNRAGSRGMGHAMPLGERLETLEHTNGWFAVVRRLTRERDRCDVETLINLHAAPRQSCMGRLVDVLTRMDNLSHLLAWAQGDVRSGETTAVTTVEMPRMQLRFVAEFGRLSSLDHDGCFVSDSAVATSEALKEQLCILDTSLVLENRQREVFILLPSYGLLRPFIQACPMSTALIMDRSHEGWRAFVKATHHKLQLHASGSFLMTQSLSAAMYLLAVRLFKREYALAARLLSSVLSDVPFVNEETWIKHLYARMADDPHPDAIAMRLRLALQCNDCGELPPFGGGDESQVQNYDEWKMLQEHRADYMRREFDKYINKWPSVSAACRLNVEQEWQLTRMLNHQKRKKFLERLRKCETKPKRGHHLTHYHVAIIEPRVGGRLFVDLAAEVGDDPSAIKELQGDLLESATQGGGGARGDKPGFRYKRPDRICANGFEALRSVENVYAEGLSCDASFGWLYLYDLFTGVCGLSFTSQELSVKQTYPSASDFLSLTSQVVPDALRDTAAASGWDGLPDGMTNFQKWMTEQGAGGGGVDGVLDNAEPIQAGPHSKSDSASLTAVPKLLFQILYLAMVSQTVQLKYSDKGSMWKIFAILSHAYDQMMDQQERDSGDRASDVDMAAKQRVAEQHRAAAAIAEAASKSMATDRFIVSDAGSAMANGAYTRDGTYQNAPRYVHEAGQLWLIRYRLPSGADWWYIANSESKAQRTIRTHKKSNLRPLRGQLNRTTCLSSQAPACKPPTFAHA
eukprot:4876425-Prymnesium_polylepis.1